MEFFKGKETQMRTLLGERACCCILMHCSAFVCNTALSLLYCKTANRLRVNQSNE